MADRATRPHSSSRCRATAECPVCGALAHLIELPANTLAVVRSHVGKALMTNEQEEEQMSDDEKHISEDQWAERFGWSSDELGNSQLLEDTPVNRMLLGRIGARFVWSQQDGDDGGYEIVAGMTTQAHGYYLCDHPRRDGDENIVGIIPATDRDDYGDDEDEA
jgi:hypothetical protein